jgi:recombination protein RecT
MNSIATIDEEIFSLKPQFENICTDKSISFEKEAEFAIQIISGNEYLLKLANGNRQALRDAVTNLGAIGISLNPVKKQAYLVPRKGKICLDISYFGMVDMATNSGSIKWVQSNVVYEQDQFTLNGFDHPPTHQYNPFSKERGPLVGVFVVVKTADGEYLTHTMSIDMVYAIRDRSEAWKGGKTCPWRTDEVEMIKKTCIKQASKLWPKTERLQAAVQYLNTDGGEGIDFIEERKEAAEQPKSNGLPVYSDEEFKAKLVGWTEMIINGKKTPDRLIAFLQTKVTLTPSQIDQIKSANLIHQE